LRSYLVLDLGSYCTRGKRLGKNDRLEELSAATLTAAAQSGSQKIIAIGREAPDAARELKDRAELVWPVNGGIQDYIVCEAMLHYYSRKLMSYLWLKPAVIVSFPAGSTEVEKRAVYDVVIGGTGAHAAYLMPDALAVAVAADKVTSDKPWLIVQVGAGAATVAVLYKGGLTHERKFPLAGNHLDKIIRRTLRDQLGRRVDLLTCRELKHRAGALGSAVSAPATDEAGLRDEEGARLDADELGPVIRSALEQGLAALVEELRWFLRELPEKDRRALERTPILLAGGTACLPGFAGWLADQLHRDVTPLPAPDQAVMQGLEMVAADFQTHRLHFQRPRAARK
jgi:rod shape-determining protein MreB